MSFELYNIFRRMKPCGSGERPEVPPKARKVEEDESDNSSSNEMSVDNSRELLERIQQLHTDQMMNDVNLIVDNRVFPAHKLILCTFSDVFQVMLMREEWSEWRESQVILQEMPQCAAVFHLFLGYFYSGKIVLTEQNVVPILSLADKYNVRSLIDVCISYMCSNVAHAANNNLLVSWLQYTSTCGHYQVSQLCQNFVKWNLEMMANTMDFGNLDGDTLSSLLQQNDLVVHNEKSLYHCMEHWLNIQRDKLLAEQSEPEVERTMQPLVEQVMSAIRFPMMSPRELAELLICPVVQKYKEFFMGRMAIGMMYHSGHTNKIEELCGAGDEEAPMFTPRLYTSESWSTLLTIDNFHALASFHTRTFFFSSRTSLAEHAGDGTCEWVVDIYPKGVWFKKFFLIVWQGTVEVPECVMPTVRLSVMCKDPPDDLTDLRMKVGILLYGNRSGVEHVIGVMEKIHHFNWNEKVLNIDELMPFKELNKKSTNDSASSYLVGPNRDQLKVHIVISPVSD